MVATGSNRFRREHILPRTFYRNPALCSQRPSLIDSADFSLFCRTRSTDHRVCWSIYVMSRLYPIRYKACPISAERICDETHFLELMKLGSTRYVEEGRAENAFSLSEDALIGHRGGFGTTAPPNFTVAVESILSDGVLDATFDDPFTRQQTQS